MKEYCQCKEVCVNTDWILLNCECCGKSFPIEDRNLRGVSKNKAASLKALRYNSGKLKWSLVHFKSLEPMVRVMEAGALKYAPDNWKKPMDRKEILECAQRHLAALMDGEELDPETLQSHAGHIMCNCLFYIFHTNRENGIK